jgi:hypothetical protein
VQIQKCCSLVAGSNSPASWLCRWPFLNRVGWASLFVGPSRVQVDSQVDPAQEKERKQPNLLARTKGQGRPFQNHPLFPRRLPSRGDDEKSPPSSCTHLAAFLRAPARNSLIADRTVPHTPAILGLQRSLWAGGTGRHPLPCPVPRLPAGTTLLAVASGPASSFILV